MLKNNFYSVQSKKVHDESISVTITIHPEHDIFKGHFPQKPVVPGVCMIQVVKELLEEHSGKSLLFQKGNQIKFLQLLIPEKGVEIEVNITCKEIGEAFQVTADFRKENNAIFKLSGIFSNIR